MIVIYATTENGKGRVMEIGRYEEVAEIDEIIVGVFDKDTILTIEEVKNAML